MNYRIAPNKPVKIYYKNKFQVTHRLTRAREEEKKKIQKFKAFDKADNRETQQSNRHARAPTAAIRGAR